MLRDRSSLLPPLGRRVTAAAATVGAVLGAAAGIGGYTFIYANGASYLGNDPAACANCHVMREQLDGWMRGSHRAVATCNDCHTPPGTVAKYAVKAENGFFHSFAFTTGLFHEPIAIKERNRRVAEKACRKCHASVVEAIDHAAGGSARLSCIPCHHDVGHL